LIRDEKELKKKFIARGFRPGRTFKPNLEFLVACLGNRNWLAYAKTASASDGKAYAADKNGLTFILDWKDPIRGAYPPTKID
jgi:hypothetical protein